MAAVTMYAERILLDGWDRERLWAVAHEEVDVIASEMDVLFRSSQPGEKTKAFTALVKVLAFLSFKKGGVEFLGHRFENHWPADPAQEARPDGVESPAPDSSEDRQEK